MKILKKTFSWIATLLLLFCTCVFAYAAYQFYNGAQISLIFGWGHAQVLTGSMEPTIPVGSLILVNERSQYSPGDIIMYLDETSNRLITHRLVSISDNIAITKGDANNTEDPPIKVTQIVGSIQYIIPGAGEFLAGLRTPTSLTIMVVSLLLIWLVPEINNHQKRKEGK